MGLFDFLKTKETAPAPAAAVFPAVLGAVTKGTFVPMNQIPDEVFSAGVMGICFGIEPADGKVYSPADAKVTQLTHSLHAIGLEAGGIEILIHVGVDTVEMNGNGFTNVVKEHQSVRKGDLLLTMDLKKIREAGHPATVIIAVANSDDFSAVEPTAVGTVLPGDDLLRVSK